MLSNFLDHLYQNKITKYHILYAIEGLFKQIMGSEVCGLENKSPVNFTT
jgi:hypothetical protein